MLACNTKQTESQHRWCGHKLWRRTIKPDRLINLCPIASNNFLFSYCTVSIIFKCSSLGRRSLHPQNLKIICRVFFLFWGIFRVFEKESDYFQNDAGGQFLSGKSKKIIRFCRYFIEWVPEQRLQVARLGYSVYLQQIKMPKIPWAYSLVHSYNFWTHGHYKTSWEEKCLMWQSFRKLTGHFWH